MKCINIDYGGVFKRSKSRFESDFGITDDLKAAIGWSMLTEVKFYYNSVYVGIVKFLTTPPKINHELEDSISPAEIPYGTAFRALGDFFISMPDELIESEV